ncbi:MAG TPA: dTMP kinase [Synergistales bacterium]|nr:dTMP kinase [Synergistales bacterium]
MFITFEGIDGCGKSTQARRLVEFLLREKGNGKALWTREPGGWPGSGDLRELILSQEFEHPWTEVFLFLADRCEHAKKIIEPALQEGVIVICERFDDSTRAYQVWGRGIELEKIERALALAEYPRPDRTILLDVSVETAMGRVLARANLDRYEKEGKSFLERVIEGYRFLAAREKSRIRPVNGEGKPDEVFARILDSLEGCF